jgi:hypothetical protein
MKEAWLNVGKSISKLQMDIELKQTRVVIWKILLFLNIISLYIKALVSSFHKPLKTSSIKLWAAVGTKRWLPWSGESWSLPSNGLTKFPEDVTVGVGIYGLSLRLECGEQYAFVFPEDCEHQFPVFHSRGNGLLFTRWSVNAFNCLGRCLPMDICFDSDIQAFR